MIADIVKGKHEHVRLKVGGGYIMLKEYADKHFGEAHRAGISDLVELKR